MLGKCPNCGKKFEIQPDWIGKAAECPYCHEQVIIEIDNPQNNPYQVAGIGERFVALFIDGMILGAVNFILFTIPSIIINLALMNSDSTLSSLISALLQAVTGLLSCVIGMAYEAFFLNKYGATPGKMVFHIKVQYNGQNPSVLRSIGRYWARALSYLICCIGYIMAFFDPEHKALHDTICDTIVVKE